MATAGGDMRIADMDWRMVEDWVRHDDRCALPLGSTEQHAGLSLATDAILAERVAIAAAVQRIDPVVSHASWMENFPWTRLADRPPVEGEKGMVDIDRLRTLPPFEVRLLLDDGSYGGRYQRDDSEMLEIWDVAVRETRAL